MHSERALAKGSCVFHKQAPMATSRRLPAGVTRRIIVSHIQLVIESGIELWGSTATDVTAFAKLSASCALQRVNW